MISALTGRVHFADAEFDAQLLRSLGKSGCGGPDVGECFATAFQIEEGTRESWHDAWRATGERLRERARQCLEKGHRISGRDTFLRAMECFRQADFFLHENLDDPRVQAAADDLRDCAVQAAPLFEPAWSLVEIPYEGTTLPGWWIPSCSGGGGRTLIVNGGLDDFAEERLFIALQARQRGWNVLCFDGPGQGMVLRKQRLYFRFDWEVVLRAVVDFVSQRPGVTKIAVWGRSFGGYLVPRGATGEPRLSAMIADPGSFDIGTMAAKMLPPEVAQADAETIDRALAEWAADPRRFFWLHSRMVAHGARTAGEWFVALRDFKVGPGVADIRCPSLICYPAAEDRTHGEASLLFDALQCPKTWAEFATADGAGDHCEVAAPSLLGQVVFDWLDEVVVP